MIMYMLIYCGLILQSESLTIRQQLLNDFIPDDVCPLGAQLFLDAPTKVYQVESKSSTSMEVVTTQY